MSDGIDVDILFVINQDTRIDELRRRAHQARSVLILSTHRPFPAERAELQRVSREVVTRTFADFLSDADMTECDARASADGRQRIRHRGRQGYAQFFIERSLHYKNALVQRRVVAAFAPRRVFYSAGLGIHTDAWKAADGVPLTAANASTHSRRPIRVIRRMLDGELNLVHRPPGDPGADAIVLGSVRRVRLPPGVRPTRRRFPRVCYAIPRLGAELCRRVAPLEATRDNRLLCTTIHEYQLSMSALATRLGRHLCVIVDGHHPSNYPESYLHSYGPAVFATGNHVNAGWFRRHGREVSAGPWFQQPVRFARCTCSNVHVVILVMNHAGDWTSLINRSDTDALISGFARLAVLRPDRQFVIRPHPTMAIDAHEGTHSIQRIEQMVADMRQPNLVVSTATLGDDLARGDLFVSEYSQVLIDAWSIGKPGVAANLTNRRSFMADYERLGFPAVASEEELVGLFDDLDQRYPQLVAAQNGAVEAFNLSQRAFETESAVLC